MTIEDGAPRPDAPDAPTALTPFPAQPLDVAWPGAGPDDWPTGPPPDGLDLDALVDRLFDRDDVVGTTYAAIVVLGGRIVAERYGGVLEHWDRPDEPVTAETPLLSWSMAKSVLHACVGVLVAAGRLDPAAPAPVPAWHAEPDDPRAAVTLDHLLAMLDGLDFVEDYVDADRSDVIDMLFGAGQSDVAAFAADRGLVAVPGTRFNYSSGTSNIVSGIVADAVGRGDAYDAFLRESLFAPIGMASARATFDAAGTWVASSYLHATARDFARFALLHLRGGSWDGRQIVPSSWVDHGRRPRSVDDEGNPYGAHWLVPGDDLGSFRAAGYEGQSILVSPGLDLVCVRLGKTVRDLDPALVAWRHDLIAAVRAGVT